MAQKLCEAKDTIFINQNESPSRKLQAIFDYCSIRGEKSSVNSDSSTNDIGKAWSEINKQRTSVFQYYEYVQFKRAKFDCEKVEYNQQTGRIKRMEFRFNGKFE